MLLFVLYFAAKLQPVHQLTDNTFELVSKGKWFIVFEAAWCPYCNRFKDIVQELRGKLDGYSIGIVDIDNEAALNSRFLIQKLPSLFVINEKSTVEIQPSFNVNELIESIKGADKRSPMFIQPFGYIGYSLFYLGQFGKMLMGFVKYLQMYMPTWAILVLGALVMAITFGLLLFLTQAKDTATTAKKNK